MKSTITVSKEVKEFLEKKKKELEIKLNRPLSWDEFFRNVFKEETVKVPRLSEEEAKILKKLIKEDRKSWKRREFV